MPHVWILENTMLAKFRNCSLDLSSNSIAGSTRALLSIELDVDLVIGASVMLLEQKPRVNKSSRVLGKDSLQLSLMPLLLPSKAMGLVLQKLKCDDLKRLRRTCKMLNSAVSPLIFTHLVINLEADSRYSVTIEILSDIARGQSALGKCFQYLEIRSLTPIPSNFQLFWRRMVQANEQSRRIIEENLSSAIPRLTALTSLSLSLDSMQSMDEAYQDKILYRISILPRLSHLSLDMCHQSTLSTTSLTIACHFKNIQSLHLSGGTVASLNLPMCLIANSPRLHTVAMDGVLACDPDSSYSLSDLLSGVRPETTLPLKSLTLDGSSSSIFHSVSCVQRHLSSLTSLTIHGGDVGASAEFWHILRQDGVRLTQLTVHQGDDALYEYLQSYSGLVELNMDLGMSSQRERRDSDSMAAVFYLCVLPKHASTLKILRIHAPFDGHYCLGDMSLEVLLICRQLVTLSVCVGSNEAKALFQQNVIKRLLDSIGQGKLPLLKSLDLSLAQTPDEAAHHDDEDGPILLVSSHHAVRKHTLINDLVRKYSCRNPSPALRGLELSTGHIHVKVLRKDANGDMWRFVLQFRSR